MKAMIKLLIPIGLISMAGCVVAPYGYYRGYAAPYGGSVAPYGYYYRGYAPPYGYYYGGYAAPYGYHRGYYGPHVAVRSAPVVVRPYR